MILKDQEKLRPKKDDLVVLRVYPENMDIFLFVFHYFLTPSVFDFSFNGPVGFNWQNIQFFATSINLKIDRDVLQYLQITESIFLKQLQKK